MYIIDTIYNNAKEYQQKKNELEDDICFSNDIFAGETKCTLNKPDLAVNSKL